MKRWVGLLVFGMLFVLFGCEPVTNEEPDPDDDPIVDDDPIDDEVVLLDHQYLSLYLGPVIDVVFDENDIVTHYVLLNPEAEIIAADLDWIGMTLEAFLDSLIEESIATGYLDLYTATNAIAIYADSSINESFETDIKAGLEERLLAEYVGCVVLFQDEVELFPILTEEGYDGGLFYSHVIGTYAFLDETQQEENLIDAPHDFLWTGLLDVLAMDFLDYQTNREAERLIEKNMLIADLALFVSNYYANVALGLVDMPDLELLLDRFTSSFQVEMDAIYARNGDRLQVVTKTPDSEVEVSLIGTFEASVFLGNVPYTLDYYRLTFYDSGVYAESWSITSFGITTSSDYIGSYSVTNGKLTLDYPGTPLFQIFLSGGKICAYDQDGVLLVFQELDN